MLIRPLLRATTPKLRPFQGTIHRLSSTTTTTSASNSSSDTPAHMKAVVTRFYNEIWNKFDITPVNDLIAPDVVFRGTLESSTTDREGFKHYVHEIGAAFPDFHQRIDELYVDGETCIAKMYWSATHSSSFRGVEPTGKKFAYPGVGIFTIRGGLIRECWVVGDTWGLWRTILGLEGIGKEDRSRW